MALNQPGVRRQCLIDLPPQIVAHHDVDENRRDGDDRRDNECSAPKAKNSRAEESARRTVRE